MDKSTSDPHAFEHDPRILAKVFYGKAKIFWCMSLSLKLFSAILGIVFVVAQTTPSFSPVIVFILAVGSELSQWRSDGYKGYAESLTRKIEYHNGFGWPFPQKKCVMD